jgi:hypothetical protein
MTTDFPAEQSVEFMLGCADGLRKEAMEGLGGLATVILDRCVKAVDWV